MESSPIPLSHADILAKLRDGRRPLPSPSAVALKLLRVVERRDVGVFEVCRVARADPVLVAKSVQMANSPLYSGLRRTAALEDAVMRIGVAALARLAVGLTLVHAAEGWSGCFDLDLFWRRSLVRGLAMQQLARRLRNLPSSEAFSLGLLAGIGRLAMVAAFGDEAAREAIGDDAGLLAMQAERWGFDEEQAGAALLEGWTFPSSLATALLAPHRAAAGRAAEIGAMVAFAREVADALGDARTEPNLAPLYLAAARVGIDSGGLVEIIGQLRADISEVAGILEIDLPQPEANAELERLRASLVEEPPLPDADAAAVVLIGAADLGPAAEDGGLRVLTAPEAAAGRVLLEQLRPDMIVLDSQAVADATGLCRDIRNSYGARPYLLVLGAAARALEFVEAGANDVMERPVDARLLRAKLALGGRAARLISALENERHNAFGMQRELVKVNANLRAAAYTDMLTGLPNRRALAEFVRRSWQEARRAGHALSCVVLDLDHFKHVNDEHGHEVGDRVLRAVARALQAQTRSSDLLARWGGEELVVICPETDLAAANVLAERMRSAVESLDGDFPRVTLSAGTAQSRADSRSSGEMLRAADAALLEAKRAGRNRVVAAG